MSHTARLVSSLIPRSLLFLTIGCLLSSCSLFDVRPSVHSQMKTVIKQKVFYGSYDNIWLATHRVLKYPIAQENQDTGMIETEYIKSVDGWIAPGSTVTPSSGIRYKIFLTLAKGRTDGRESVRITIDKKVEILRDFFSPAETLESDGLEEKVLFYRIERELIVADALRRAPSN